jgi:iron complex outermembrane receptor protein
MTAAASLMATASFNALGQGPVLEEIIVTAQKREQSTQDIPIAVNAFDSDFINKSGIVDTADLVAYTPGLNGQSYQDTESVFTVRGIGTQAFGVGADNSVGMFIDDQPIGRTTLVGTSFFDVERIEVVKGPQGTLFGRNASAGAIAIHTNKASTDASSLYFKIGGGNEGQELFEGTGNWAATDRLALRLAGRYEKRDGTFEDANTGDELNDRDHQNLRGAIHYNFTDAVYADLVYERLEVDNRTAATFLDNAFDDKISINRQPKQEIESDRATLRFVWDVNDSMTLTSNTSYLDYDMTAVPVDADATDTFVINLFEPQEGEQFVQEFRLNGTSERIDWFVGASYIQEDIASQTTYQWSDFILVQALVEDFTLCESTGLCEEFVEQPNFADTDNTSMAVYGDLAWRLGDRTTLTVGARYTQDEKDFSLNQPLPDSVFGLLAGDALIKSATAGTITDDDTWSSFDPRIALDFALTDDVLLYASVASGYKSGGFNSNPDRLLAEGVSQKPGSFDEESVIAYEVGVKSRFWNDRAQLNAALFYNDYEDFQIEDNANLTILIQNAAEVETQGLEIDGNFLLTENLSLIATYAYLDAEFKEGSFSGIDISGNRMPRSPENTASIILDYSRPIGDAGEWNVRGEYVYSDSFYFDALNEFEQDSYGLVNARLGWRSGSGRWGVALIGENLADEEYFVHQTLVLDPLGFPGMGRMYRLELTANF